MAQLIAVSIDCRSETARHVFEEIVSRRRDYLITKGQGTGTVDMLLLVHRRHLTMFENCYGPHPNSKCFSRPLARIRLCY